MNPSTAMKVVSGILLIVAFDAAACAGCRNPNIPITKVDAVHLSPGELRTGLSMGAMGIQISHEAGCSDLTACEEFPVQPLYLHNQKIFSGEIRALGEFGLSRVWGVELQVPLRLVQTTIQYTTPENRPYEPIDPDVHHRNETLIGLGDPWLLLRLAFDFNELSLSARLGTTIPIGRTEPNPFELGDRGERHQHIQFGSGTVEPMLLMDVSRQSGLWLYSAYFQGQTGLYENSHGFQSGAKISGGVQVGRRVWRTLSGSLGTEVFHEEPERWNGQVRQDGNLGRTELQASLSLIQSFKLVKLGASIRAPFYRHIVPGDEDPGTLSTPFILGIFVNRSFRFI